MNGDWRTERLGDVCDLIARGVAPVYLDAGGMCVVNQKCVRDHAIDYSLARRHDHDAKIVPCERLIRVGDVLVNSTGTGTLGRVAQVRVAPKEPTTVDTHVTIVRPKAGLFHPDFFGYVMRTIETALIAAGEGASGQTELPRSKLASDFQVTFPESLAEQRRIVAILDDAFEGIAVSIELAARCAASASRVPWQYLADVFEQSGSDWIREPISKRVRFVDYRGKTPPKRAAGVRLITAKNVKMGFVQRAPEEFIDESAYASWMTRGYPARGDVLFTTEAPLANVAQLDTDEPVVVGQRLITMQADKDRLAPTFLKYMLLSRPLQRAIRARGTGATVQGIKASLLKQIEVMYPASLERQLAIVSRLDAIFASSEELARLHQRKAAAFVELKQSLLARAFAGELTGKLAAANDNSFATPQQAANILAFMHWRHERAKRSRFFGHVMAQKSLDLVERVGGVELGRKPYKDAAGPNDKPHMTRAEVWAREHQFFEFVERTGGGYDFKKLGNYGAMLSAARTALKPIEAELGRVANILVGKDKIQAEIFATVLAAWNNLIIDGKDATEAAILREARDDWHPDKIDLPVAKFQDAIREIRSLALVPDGTAKAVRHKQAALF